MSVSMASGSSVEGSLADGSTAAAPEGWGAAPVASAGFLKSMDGMAMSRVKTFGGTAVCLDAILASSSAFSLYLRVTWLSLSPSNLSSRRRTVLQYASIVSLWQLASFITWSMMSWESPTDIETLDDELDGDAEAAEEGLVLYHVVGCREVHAYHMAHVFSEG